MKQEDHDLRFGGASGPDLAGEARLNEFWQDADILALLGRVDAGRFARWPRLHLTLNDAGIRHRFIVAEGRHDWMFWRQALPEAIRHVGAVMTR